MIPHIPLVMTGGIQCADCGRFCGEKDFALGHCDYLLCGAIEKDDELDSGDVKTAENLAQDWKDNKGSVKDYWED